MGEIRKKIKIMWGGRSTTVDALIDSGATDNFIKPKLIEKIHGEMWDTAKYYLGDGRKRLGKWTSFFIQRRNRRVSVYAIATDKIEEDLVLGQEFLQDNHVKVNFSNDTFELGKYAPRTRKIARY